MFTVMKSFNANIHLKSRRVKVFLKNNFNKLVFKRWRAQTFCVDSPKVQNFLHKILLFVCV